MELTMRGMSSQDWPTVRAIYLEGIATGQATFETGAPTWEEWGAAHRTDCRIVALEDDQVVGWAALSPVSDRCAYAGVAEVSVYVAAPARGRGWGQALLGRLIEESERAGVWSLQSGTFPENLLSLALQEACGFRRVGVRRRLGRLNGVWRDVILLERRSDVAGR
ncbi:MAG: GNAT family N-acetyltransferase [Proteobacteria bacterium]|nr:GNAT family N-acetyltransferase [Pseudomonadota bacterium]MBU1740724.1 GNAT family N-acetyltransferase [Pseudomonadota bacterium]